MFNAKPDRPYLENWLRRTRKLLSGSGRLSEVALILSKEDGDSPERWSQLIRDILEERTTPTLDFLTRIDAVLAKPVDRDSPDQQPRLF